MPCAFPMPSIAGFQLLFSKRMGALPGRTHRMIPKNGVYLSLCIETVACLMFSSSNNSWELIVFPAKRGMEVLLQICFPVFPTIPSGHIRFPGYIYFSPIGYFLSGCRTGPRTPVQLVQDRAIPMAACGRIYLEKYKMPARLFCLLICNTLSSGDTKTSHRLYFSPARSHLGHEDIRDKSVHPCPALSASSRIPGSKVFSSRRIYNSGK